MDKRGQKPKMQVSQKLKEFLNSKGKKGESYEDIIWRLLDEKKN